AIVDDIGAVAIIALAYTTDLNLPALGGVLVVLAAMITMNRFGVRRLLPYLLTFATLWLLVTASGIHSTIAGVFAALTIPLRATNGSSPLRRLEHALHPWVMFGVTPLFAFVSAGVTLTGMAMLFDPVPVGVALGLLIGKQMGVFGAIFATVRTGFAGLPDGTRWRDIYGAAVLCGIGFTMSLFIGALAFPDNPAHAESAKIGTLAGSIMSALCGWAILRFGSIGKAAAADVKEAQALFAQDEPESRNRD
ncbi:MAG TPA: Na+/H+ antiporter NhaA, partial [Sphingomicrobium sp.]|nr:Na+/H+ antiporter NhaA [Sphingomicrobium sp.]